VTLLYWHKHKLKLLCWKEWSDDRQLLWGKQQEAATVGDPGRSWFCPAFELQVSFYPSRIS
jgi:hypothetical protein